MQNELLFHSRQKKRRLNLHSWAHKVELANVLCHDHTCYISNKVLLLFPLCNVGTSTLCFLSLPPFLTKAIQQVNLHTLSLLHLIHVIGFIMSPTKDSPSPYLTLRQPRQRTPLVEWQTEQSVFPVHIGSTSFSTISRLVWMLKCFHLRTNQCTVDPYQEYRIACNLLHHTTSFACTYCTLN